ncbi:MAG: tetratricopeptide repeat protein [Myxococcaceae bacterium]|nr:tetratricopeptide repeat protein [Myxococcaceae bacterium]MCI0672511.1 tetratricopeptide repeat protein [Myxococcaceae bacterium]
MHRLFASILLVLSFTATAQEKRQVKDQDLGRKASRAPDTSLAGDLTRKTEETKATPLRYDRFRLGVEMQVAGKRREQIESLKKIIAYSTDVKETPKLLFRLGELYWEESKYFFFEANRKDDDLLDALNRGDKAAEAAARSGKQQLQQRQKQYVAMAMEQYKEIVQSHRNFERMDEVLFFLGQLLMENGDEKAALKTYELLIKRYPESKFLPDAYLAFGEYYFNNSKGKRDWLEKALKAYEKAASYPDSQVYGFALYKQGWCHFNLTDYERAKDRFKAVVLYGEYAGAAAVEKDGKAAKGRMSLVREARGDYVRSYSREGDVMAARDAFGKVASDPEDRFGMMKQLANFYYADGKDREAAIVFNQLINEKPLSPEAPGFQGKIVDCVLRAGNKEMTVRQVRRLVKILQDVEGSKVVRDEKDKRLLSDAKDLAERTMSNLAVTWHKEGQKTRDDATFGFANEVYSDYLTLFPENPKAYDLRFFWAELLNDNLQKYEKAAHEYTRVVLQDAKALDAKDAKGNPKPGKPGKYLVNAAYNAVLAWDAVVKQQQEAGQLKAEPSPDGQKQPMPGPVMALYEACERYIKYVPNGDKRVEITYKAGQLLYRYNHLDEAIARFSDIALNYPDYQFEDGQRASEVAANLVLDSYNLKKDYAKVNEWAQKFYKNPKLAKGKFRDELEQVLEQSAFKLVNQMEARKEYAKAAQAYLSFVDNFPQSNMADQALYNASIDFFKGKMLDKAVEVRQALIRRYPASKYVPACIYDNAEAYETVGDFDQAADTYEAYVRGYERSHGSAPSRPARRAVRGKAKGKRSGGDDAAAQRAAPQVWEEGKAQAALINAGVLREGLGQLKAALRARERYLELWPKAKDAEQVFLSTVDLTEKMGASSRAIHLLEEYERTWGVRDPDKMLMAEGRIVTIYEKQRRPRDVTRMLVRAGRFYGDLGRTQKSRLSPAALDVVGRASLVENEEVYRNYTGVRLRWGSGSSLVSTFKAGIKEKARSLELVKKAYTQTVALKAPEPAICALHKIGKAAAHFYDALVNAPMPRGLPEEVQSEVRAQLGQEAQPLREQAAEAFAAAVQKSHELDVYNECSRAALAELRSTYRPDQFPEMAEAVAPLKALGEQVVGADLLTALQAAPEVVAPAGTKRDERLQSDVEQLKRQVGEGSRTSPARGEKPAQGKPADAEKEPDAFSEEPEDAL